MTACTPPFLELENDFGLTPKQALGEKVAMLQDQVRQKQGATHDERDKMLRRLEKLLQVDSFLTGFTDFTNETSWNKRFDIPLAVFLEMCVDANLKIFMGMHTRGDLLSDDKGAPADRKALYSAAPSLKQPTPGMDQGRNSLGGAQQAIELV